MKKSYLFLTSFLTLMAISLLLGGCQKEVLPDFSLPPPLKEVAVEEQQQAEEVSGITYTVDITDDGFLPPELKIKVGDTVKWVNARTGGGTLSQASIVGDSPCNRIKSPILKVGGYFEYTFDLAETCRIVEGVTTNQYGQIVVEE